MGAMRARQIRRLRGTLLESRPHTDGRLAQRESTAFTRQGSLVQSQYRPPINPLFIKAYSYRDLTLRLTPGERIVLQHWQ